MRIKDFLKSYIIQDIMLCANIVLLYKISQENAKS